MEFIIDCCGTKIHFSCMDSWDNQMLESIYILTPCKYFQSQIVYVRKSKQSIYICRESFELMSSLHISLEILFAQYVLCRSCLIHFNECFQTFQEKFLTTPKCPLVTPREGKIPLSHLLVTLMNTFMQKKQWLLHNFTYDVSGLICFIVNPLGANV